MAIFEALLAIDDALVDWVLHATPSSDDERAQMKRVLALRGDLEDDLDLLVRYRLKLAVAGLADEATKLDALSTELRGLARSVDTASRVLTIAGEAIDVAGKVVAFVTA